MADLRILGISGSLRKSSYNTAALRISPEYNFLTLASRTGRGADAALTGGTTSAREGCTASRTMIGEGLDPALPLSG